MNEATPITWIWMIPPLIILLVNLVWPRKVGVKIAALVVLVLAAYLHGFMGLNPLDRVVGLAQRILLESQNGTSEQVVRNLRIGQAQAHQTLFQVSLGLTMAVILAATPVNFIQRLRSRKSNITN